MILKCCQSVRDEGCLWGRYEGKTTGDDFSSKGLPVEEALPLAVGRLRRGLRELEQRSSL